jgi:hypothetical protein
MSTMNREAPLQTMPHQDPFPTGHGVPYNDFLAVCPLSGFVPLGFLGAGQERRSGVRKSAESPQSLYGNLSGFSWEPQS